MIVTESIQLNEGREDGTLCRTNHFVCVSSDTNFNLEKKRNYSIVKDVSNADISILRARDICSLIRFLCRFRFFTRYEGLSHMSTFFTVKPFAPPSESFERIITFPIRCKITFVLNYYFYFSAQKLNIIFLICEMFDESCDRRIEAIFRNKMK